MAKPDLCPQCGSGIPAGSPAGLCPKCLVLAGLESQPPGDPKLSPTQPSPPAASSGFVPPAIEELAARFPQLEILELVGRGGMGAVYKARQKELDRLVAVKILPPEVSRDPAFAERFTREARALARLSHPNIVAVYDFGRTGDGLFHFVMEFVDGVNLRQAIQSGGMSPKEALAIVPQICDALQFAHDEGLVHRDIKPENILVDKRGRVKIADFGLAKLLGHAPGDVSLTGTEQVMGTLRYMAPEQIEGTKAVDHRADIYSLGVVFYELLTGELPIGRFAPPSRKVEIDVRLDEVVLRALEKEPEQRYQHVREVKTHVDAIRGASPDLTPAPAAGGPGTQGKPLAAGHTQAGPLAVLRFWAVLAGWTAVVVGACLYLLPLVMMEWWPWAYDERWEFQLKPQSDAYQSVKLSGERRLYYWGQSGGDADRLISTRPWRATANIPGAGSGTGVTVSLDAFREQWSWTTPAREVWHSQDEVRPESVVQWMNDAGIDVRRPGVREEAAALVGLLKDAANGVLPGDKRPRDFRPTGDGAKIGPFTPTGVSGWGYHPLGMVGLPLDMDRNQVARRWIAAGVFLAIWLPGVVIIVRRHRRRLAAAPQKEREPRYQEAGQVKADIESISGGGSSSAPAEAPPVQAASPRVADSSHLPTPRFSRKAILGAGWAGLFFVALVPFLLLREDVSTGSPPRGEHGEPSTLLIWGLLLGAATPFGTTILGVVSLSEIRHSRGRLIGLPLALADALLFPLLLLDVLICFACYYPFATHRFLEELALLAIIAGLLIGAVVDFLIVSWAWRRAAVEAVGSTRRDREAAVSGNREAAVSANPGGASSSDRARAAQVLTAMGALTVASGVLTFLLLAGVFVDTYHFDIFFRQDGVQIPLLVLQTLAVPVGLLMVLGGLSSWPQGSSWPRFGATLGLVPLTPAWLITLPLGIWTLTILRRREAACGRPRCWA